jgi:hypothetical protein
MLELFHSILSCTLGGVASPAFHTDKSNNTSEIRHVRAAREAVMKMCKAVIPPPLKEGARPFSVNFSFLKKENFNAKSRRRKDYGEEIFALAFQLAQ